MTRLPGRAVASRAQQSSTRAKFRKHKVILESVTQKRKKLRSILSFEANAPPGYTFIPAGNPQFTIACKEVCREQGLKVFTVTTTPHQNTHGLSQQVHRVGYHFPSTVVAQKCMELGLYLSENGNVVPFEKFGTNYIGTEGSVDVSQATINTEARDVIRDLFPNIPDNDINQIIKTAFQKGQHKVGTAVELPLARRAQLAVVAHIRHIYTDYDKLLKKTSFQTARRQVEDSTLERLVQWRGEDESGMPELEDVFREVIVISDDEEEEETNNISLIQDKQMPSMERDLSVEFLSTHVVTDKFDADTVADGNQSVRPFPVKLSRQPSASRCGILAGPRSHVLGNEKVDRRGFSRYQAWDRAMNRYREKKRHHHNEEGLPRSSMALREEPATSLKQLHSASQAPGRPLTPIIERIFDPSFKGVTYESRPHSSDKFYRANVHSPPSDSRLKSKFIAANTAPDILHFPDGSVFSKIPPISSHKRSSRPIDLSSAPVFVAGPRLSSEGPDHNILKKRVHPSTHRSFGGNQVDGSPRSNAIIPSVEHRESPPLTMISAGSRVATSKNLSDAIPAASITQYRRPIDELSKGIDLIDLTEDSPEVSKRRKLESRELSHELHWPLSYNDDLAYSRTGNTDSQRVSIVMHKQSFLPMPESDGIMRMPMRRNGTDPSIMTASREQYNQAFYRSKDLLRESSGAPTYSPLEHADTHNETSFAIVGRPRIDHLPQSRGTGFKTEYETDSSRVTIYREDRPTSSHHSRGSGSDDAVWRNKANSYRSQRRLLEAQDPLWLKSMPSQSSLQVGGTQRPERVTHSPAFPQENAVNTASRLNIDTRAENASQHYAIQSRRVSSQPPLLDTQRKRDTLPVSAMRRYEVQLEKSKNPHRYEADSYQ